MAQLSDLKWKYRLLIQGYPFRRVDWRPGTALRKPLKDARIALLTTAGFYLPHQKPFDESYRHDDCSYREIPWGAPVTTLQIGQSSEAFDHSGIEADRNLALPLDRLRELVDAGVVGKAAPRHFSIMGSLIAPARLISQSGPEIARKLQEDAVDGVLVAPVCPFCHQAAGLCKASWRRQASLLCRSRSCSTSPDASSRHVSLRWTGCWGTRSASPTMRAFRKGSWSRRSTCCPARRWNR